MNKILKWFLIVLGILFTLMFLALVALYYSYGGGQVCLTAIIEPTFRTHKVTGECEYGGGSPCINIPNPDWKDYTPGCDISDAEKMEM